MGKILLKLFLVFFKIGSFSIGGGYAIIPLIQNEMVNNYQWLTLKQYTDIITISQMTPGPLVVNIASFVGIQLANVIGDFIATVASVLSGIVIAIILHNFFKKYQNIKIINKILDGLKASSTGLIASAAATIIGLAIFSDQTIKLFSISIDHIALIIFLTSFYVLRKYKANPMLVIALSGLAGFILYF